MPATDPPFRPPFGTRDALSFLLTGWTAVLLLSACDGASPSEPGEIRSAQSSHLVVRDGDVLKTVRDTGGVADTVVVAMDGQVIGEHELSPDGDHVAFFVRSQGFDEPTQLHVAKLDGTESVRISGFDGALRNRISWSPDSRRLVLVATSPIRPYVVNRDGTGLESILEGTLVGGSPHWSPAGGRIVYAGWDAESEGFSGLWTVRPDGSDVRQITDDRVFLNDLGALFPEPRFSPSGEWIVFESEYDLHLVRSDGTDRRQLTFTPRMDDWYPRWSPDGRWIAYHADGGANWIVRIRDVSTGDLVGSIGEDFTQDAVYPSWSPDGERIALMHTGLSSGVYAQPGPGSIIVVESEELSGSSGTPAPIPVGQGTFPEWWRGR